MAYAAMAWWVGGFIATVFSCVGSAMGNVLKRLSKGHADGHHKRGSRGGACSCTPMWMTGFILMALSVPLDGVALALADQSLVVPLSESLTVILNHVIVPWLLGERLGMIDMYASMMMVAGMAMTTAAANHKDRAREFEELLRLAKQKDYAGAAAALAITCVLLLLLLWRTPSCFARLRPGMYAFLAGALGSHSLLCYKMVAEMLKCTVRTSANAFESTWFYLFVFLTVLFYTLQLHFIKRGIREYQRLKLHATSFVPPYYTLLIPFGATFGGIYYKEFDDMLSPIQEAFYPLGLVVIVLGVMLLSCRPQRDLPDSAGGRGRSASQDSDDSDLQRAVELGNAEWWRCWRGGDLARQHRYSKVPGSPDIIATDPNMKDKEEVEFGLDSTFEDDDFQLPGAGGGDEGHDRLHHGGRDPMRSVNAAP